MSRLLQMLGLCARAGKLISGEKACLQAIRAGSVYAVLLDGAAAKNAVKSITDACVYHKTELLRTEPDRLGDAIGHPGRMVAGVTDEKLAEKIITLGREDRE